MVAKKKINIKNIFLELQKQMKLRLTSNRKILTHSVTKGDSNEIEWLKMLDSYLPGRYKVDNAFVIDCEGNISEQIDIVIYDKHYSPFILKQDKATYIPAESVYAVIEVKPTLDNKNIEYASNKALSVRRLKRTTAPIVHAGGEIDKPKEPFNILAGILTIDGEYKDVVAEKVLSLSDERVINFGCSLKHTSFWLKDTNKIEKSLQNEALIFFFLNLLDRLQKLGTVTAINLKEYMKFLK